MRGFAVHVPGKTLVAAGVDAAADFAPRSEVAALARAVTEAHGELSTLADAAAGRFVRLAIGHRGAGGGLWGVLSNLAFIRQFGVLHLGEISGLNTAITVFASAIGPVAFSLANDTFGSFDAAAAGCIVGLTVLLLVAVLLPQPLDRAPQ